MRSNWSLAKLELGPVVGGWPDEQMPNDISINFEYNEKLFSACKCSHAFAYRFTPFDEFLARASRTQRAFIIFQLSQVCYSLPRYCVSIACSVLNYCFLEPTKIGAMPNLMLWFSLPLYIYMILYCGFKVGPLPSTAFDE